VTPDVESELLIKALRINTLSKLTFVDMNKFVVLIKDVFPGISVKDIVYQ
jgi:dynein heavy chain 2